MTPDPFDAMRLLVDRIKEIADKLDLELVNIAFIPEDPDDYHSHPRNVVSAFFHIKPDAVKSVLEIEKERLDTAFDAILDGITVEQDEEGNIILGGDSVDDHRRHEGEQSEPEKTEEELRFEKRQAEAQAKLMKWIEGQDE